MKYLPFVLKHLRRNWVRTLSTVLAMSVCIFLFCTLQTVIEAVNWGLKSANADRLITRHAVSLVFNLPLSYKERIKSVPGVKSVATVTWFGGVYKDFKNFFANFAIDPEEYLAMYPEYLIPPDQMKAFLGDRRSCIIGRGLAKKYGWKVGDTFQLESFIPPYRKGSPFDFLVLGIYDPDPNHPGTADNLMFFHYKYLYEGTGRNVGAGTYAVEVSDPKQAGVISKQIDALFDNSDAQTHTETEAAFVASFISLAGNLALLLNFIGLAVSFTILLVTANTMSMAVRERRNEIAVLKTLGFPSGLVMALILAEGLLLGAMGGAVGLFLSKGMIKALPAIPMVGDAVRQFPNLGLSAQVGLFGFSIALFIGLAAGFVPAFLAYRARITEMLRQV